MKPVGLSNASNNCWANSIFQLLANSRRLRQAVQAASPRRPTAACTPDCGDTSCDHRGALACLQYMLVQYEEDVQQADPDPVARSAVSSVNSCQIRTICCSLGPNFSPSQSRQEDAHEGLSYILDNLIGPGIECETTYHYSWTKPVDMERLDAKARERYTSIDAETLTRTATTKQVDLSCLPTHDNFYETILNIFQSVEEVPRPSACYYSSRDHTLHEFEKLGETLRLGHVPPYLLIHMKRFRPIYHPDNSVSYTKCTDPVEMDLALNLSTDYFVRCTRTKRAISYLLKGLVFHLGHTMDRGHYVTAVQQEEGEWWLCDDEKVVALSETELGELLPHGYLYLYELKGSRR